MLQYLRLLCRHLKIVLILSCSDCFDLKKSPNKKRKLGYKFIGSLNSLAIKISISFLNFDPDINELHLTGIEVH